MWRKPTRLRAGRLKKAGAVVQWLAQQEASWFESWFSLSCGLSLGSPPTVQRHTDCCLVSWRLVGVKVCCLCVLVVRLPPALPSDPWRTGGVDEGWTDVMELVGNVYMQINKCTEWRERGGGGGLQETPVVPAMTTDASSSSASVSVFVSET